MFINKIKYFIFTNLLRLIMMYLPAKIVLANTEVDLTFIAKRILEATSKLKPGESNTNEYSLNCCTFGSYTMNVNFSAKKVTVEVTKKDDDGSLIGTVISYIYQAMLTYKLNKSLNTLKEINK